MITGISAVTLATHDMAFAVRFYRMLGFETIFGGEAASFTSFRIGGTFLNLILQPSTKEWGWWGRLIFYDDDVDGLYRRVAERWQERVREGEFMQRFAAGTLPREVLALFFKKFLE